jgi:hypothetical protein
MSVRGDDDDDDDDAGEDADRARTNCGKAGESGRGHRRFGAFFALLAVFRGAINPDVRKYNGATKKLLCSHMCM